MKNKFMDIALEEAQKAFSLDEVPVGCVIVYRNKIIAKAYNVKEKNKCSLYHAELIAIKEACVKMNNWRLNGCEIYVTMKPCPMCASAIKQSRISKVYYIVDNYNNLISDQILGNNDLNKSVSVEKIIDKSNYYLLVEKFFQKKRKDDTVDK